MEIKLTLREVRLLLRVLRDCDPKGQADLVLAIHDKLAQAASR